MPRTSILSRAALWLLAALALTLVAGCGRDVEPTSQPIETAEDLLQALRKAGAGVEETVMMATHADLAGGRVWFVGSERVEVYPQESEARQQAVLQDLLQRLPPESATKLWGRGRIVVVYDGVDGPTVALLSGLLGDSVSLPVPAPDQPYPPAVTSAIGWLAETAGVDPGQVTVESFEPAEWPDACLGLADPDEACAGVLTPGWRITLRIGADEFALHTDEMGGVVRQEP